MYNQDTPQEVNPRKLFVGSIPFSTTEDELREIFAEYGEIVELKLITDRMTGRSKGIAFVEYATEEQAQAALEAVNGMEIDGRTLFVSIARPPAPREDRGPRNFDRRGGRGFGGGGRQGGFSRGGRDN